MACQTIYDEMMSLQLDGLLDPDEERKLLAHLVSCAVCGPYWEAMKEANTLLVASAELSLPPPAEFTVKVMARIAETAVLRPNLDFEPLAVHGVAGPLSVLPARSPAPGDYGVPAPVHLPDNVREWQERIAAYVRGVAAVGLSLVGAAGLLLALVVSGALEVDGPLASAVQVTRTLISAADTWVRNQLASVSSDVAIGVGVLFAALIVAGWQVVANYQRAATQPWLEPGAEGAVA